MRHGTITCYTKGRCHCLACTDAWRDYQRAYSRDRARGLSRRVPATEARRHIEALRESGMTRAAIAMAAGVNHLVIKRVERGERQSVNARTSDAILGVRVGANPEGCTNSAQAAERLLVEMRRAGFTNEELEQRLHITAIERIRSQRHVRPKTWAKITLFYLWLCRQGLVPADVLHEVTS